MLSNQTRQKIQFLCARIERGEPIDLAEMTWLQKHANTNRSAYDMVQRARRRATAIGPREEGSLDAFLDDLSLGDPDPSNHLTGESTIDDIAAFFKSPDWMRRD